MACATSVEIGLDHGLKTQLCTGAQQIGIICEGTRPKTRECGSENGMYMSHLKNFRVKMKQGNSQAKQLWPGLAYWQKSDVRLTPNSK